MKRGYETLNELSSELLATIGSTGIVLDASRYVSRSRTISRESEPCVFFDDVRVVLRDQIVARGGLIKLSHA